MKRNGKGSAKANKSTATAKKKRDRGFITSLHVLHPEMLKRIRAAAKLRDESVSKFLLTVGDREAAKVLGGACPNCGQPMKKTVAAKKAA